MQRFIFLTYAVAHAAILVWILRASFEKRVPGALIIGLVAIGLVYDNTMIAIGSLIGIGPTLEALSWPRFALHAIFTPFIMVAAAEIATSAGIGWSKTRWFWPFIWVLTLAMVAYGLFIDLIPLKIQPACDGDLVRYTSSAPPHTFCFEGQQQLPGHGIPWPSVVVILVALPIGFRLWRERQWMWLFATAAAMFLAASIPPQIAGLVPGNGGEVILQWGYAASAIRFARPKPA